MIKTLVTLIFAVAISVISLPVQAATPSCVNSLSLPAVEEDTHVIYQRAFPLPNGDVLFASIEVTNGSYVESYLTGVLVQKSGGLRKIPGRKIQTLGTEFGSPTDFRIFPARKISVTGKVIPVLELQTRMGSMLFQIDANGFSMRTPQLSLPTDNTLYGYHNEPNAFRDILNASPIHDPSLAATGSISLQNTSYKAAVERDGHLLMVWNELDEIRHTYYHSGQSGVNFLRTTELILNVFDVETTVTDSGEIIEMTLELETGFLRVSVDQNLQISVQEPYLESLVAEVSNISRPILRLER